MQQSIQYHTFFNFQFLLWTDRYTLVLCVRFKVMVREGIWYIGKSVWFSLNVRQFVYYFSSFFATIIIIMWKRLSITLINTLFIIILACPPNCNNCQTSLCKACAQRYSLTIEGQCTLSQESRCSYYNKENECLKCEPSFVLIDSVCQKDYSGCISYDTFVCNKCSYGKELKNDSCVGILNCEKYDKQENCIECRQYFELSENICKDVSQRCIIADEGTGVCILCNNNYKLNGYECLKENIRPANCYIYKNESRCISCKTGYGFNSLFQCAIPGNLICKEFLSNGNCLLCNGNNLVNINGSCLVKNCLKGSADNCLECQQGYLLRNNSCVLVQPNCLLLFADNSNRCEQCRPGFFHNINSSCSQLPNNCTAVNIISAVCIQCRVGFLLNNLSNCVPPTRIANCQMVIQTSGQCRNCIAGFFLSQNQCWRVSALCKGNDRSTGLCLDCITGYSLVGGECRDPNCLNRERDSCIRCRQSFIIDGLIGLCKYSDSNCEILSLFGCDVCKRGFYLQLNICKTLPPFCINYRNGACLLCRDGFSLKESICIVPLKNCQNYDFNSSISFCKNCEFGFSLTDGLCLRQELQATTILSQRDRNCLKYNNTICIQCSNRYFSENNICVPVNNQCNRFNATNGRCITCYLGYMISNGSCIPEGGQVDQFCRRFENNVCRECYSGYFIKTITGECIVINPFCRISNETTGDCLSCYQGYIVSEGKCVPTSVDPNCVRFDENQTCVRCSSRFFMRNGLCTPVSPLCRTFNVTIGICLSCYQGYTLSVGSCRIGVSNEDIYCRLKNNNNICVQCYPNYYLSKNQSCILANILCKTIDLSNGQCLSCYPGYLLKDGNCPISQGNESDPNCFRFTAEKQCLQCYASFFVNNGLCKKVNELCKSHNRSNGNCLSCYPGYELTFNGECVIPFISTTLATSDPYCLKFQNRVCVSCRQQFYYDGTKCAQVNTLCRTYDPSNGFCSSCYQGYVLNPPNCDLPADVLIPFCSMITNGRCVRCIQGYYVQSADKCSPASILCQSYDENNGSCLTCISGYFLQEGKCIFPSLGFDRFCLNYDVSAYCTMCRQGYYLSNYICTRIDSLCINFNMEEGRCLECRQNKTPNNARCL